MSRSSRSCSYSLCLYSIEKFQKIVAPIAPASFPGGDGGGVTPVPISNTEVKPSSADGTALETRWESRTLPGFSSEAPVNPGASLYFPRPHPEGRERLRRGGSVTACGLKDTARFFLSPASNSWASFISGTATAASRGGRDSAGAAA